MKMKFTQVAWLTSIALFTPRRWLFVGQKFKSHDGVKGKHNELLTLLGVWMLDGSEKT